MSSGSTGRLSDSRVFERLLDLPAAERARYLEVELPDEPDRRQQLLEMAAYFDVKTNALQGAALDAVDPLRPGDRLDEYHIVRELHRGGMGIVYLATEAALGRQVVVKAPAPRLARDPAFQQRFENEARLAARCDSAFIARVYRFIRRGEDAFIAQEYVDGPSLRERLESGPLPLAEALAAGEAIASAMRTAHAAGIIHRDLKPENVVQTRQGGVFKVLDFGIAKEEGTWALTALRLTVDGQRLVTPAYASPEQLLGHPVDRRSDIFAFGIVFFEVLTGQHPFGTASSRGDAATILARDAQLLTDTGFPPGPVAEQLQIILDRCLAKDPSHRYDSAADLEGDIRSIREALNPVIAPVAPAVRHEGAIWWWRFHLVTASLVQGATMLAVWRVREWWPAWRVAPGGPDLTQTLLFFVPLILVSLMAVLRLGLAFTAAQHPSRLRRQYGQVERWLRAGDAVVAGLLALAGLLISGEHAGWATLLISLGVGIVAVGTFVEPETAAEALTETDRRLAARRTGARVTTPSSPSRPPVS